MADTRMTADEWAALLGWGWGGGKMQIDPFNPSGDYYDQVSGGMRTGTEPFSVNYATLPGYEQFYTAANATPGGDLDPVAEQFDLAGYLAANPGYTAWGGNFGGRTGTANWIQDANGLMVGDPMYRQNTALSDARNMAAVIAGGYLGGSYAFGGAGSAPIGAGAASGGGGAAASGGAMSAADAAALDAAMIDAGAGATGVSGGAAAGGGLSSAELAAMYGDAGYGAGMTGGETAAYDAGLAAGGTSSGGAATRSGAGSMSGNGDLYAQLGSAALQQYFNNRARDDMLDAGRESNALLRYMYDQNRADNQPLLDMRNATLPQIQGLISNPSSITSDPGYQFGLTQGTNALSRGAAARGMTYSGAAGKALTEYGQDYAGSKLNDSLNRLMGVAGLGQVGATANQQNNQNYATNASNNLQQMGNVRGSSYVNSGNLWGNALGNWWNNQQFRDAYGN